MIQFGAPNALWLLWLIPLLVIFFRHRARKRREALARFASDPLLNKLFEGVHPARQRWKLTLSVLAAAFLTLALARPQYGVKEEIIKRKGMDVVVALDTSDSMLAEDIRPNRLRVARREIAGLIDLLQGDRIALVPFSGEAFVQCPLTLDYAAAHLFLQELDTNTVERPGTALGRAIEVATRCFVQEERKYKVLILITDGEDTVGSPDPLEAAASAAEQGVRIYTIGVGTRDGEPIPMRDTDDQLVAYRQTKQGDKVLSRLDDVTLEKIARDTGGAFYHATTDRFELNEIYQEISALEEKELSSAMHTQGVDRFQYLLAIALVLLIVQQILSARTSLGNRRKGDNLP